MVPDRTKDPPPQTSSESQTPVQTLREGSGTCEDLRCEGRRGEGLWRKQKVKMVKSSWQMMPGMADDARFIFHFLTKSAAMKLGFVGNSS